MNRPAIALKPLPSADRAEGVMSALASYIARSRLKPGDRLPAERALMEGLAVGRSTVREVIRQLQALGIVESRRGSGTYLLRSVGYSKEMDPNSASPNAAAPLPFRRMTRYPYSAPERYPDTQRHRDYQERWNTRVVGRPVPPLELSTRAR